MRMPEPHQKYIVKRGNIFFVATPCYGMHRPWWVPMSPNGETEPEDMDEKDMWFPINRIEW